MAASASSVEQGAPRAERFRARPTANLSPATARRHSSSSSLPRHGGGNGGALGRGNVHLLLVEDSDDDAFLIAHRLSMRSTPAFVVDRVETLAEAMQRLSEPSQIDLILLDITLPDGRGLPVLRDIMSAAPSTPVVVLTGLTDERFARACVEAGATDYVEKDSASRRELQRAIDYALARARAQHLTRQLEHADRLAALGQISAGVAHEVNNPATLIQANLHEASRFLSKLGTGSDEQSTAEVVNEVQRMLTESLDGIDRIARVVAELSEFAGRGQGEVRESVDLAALCRSCTHLVSYQLRHRARLVFDLQEVPSIWMDPRRFGQVIVNLAINAAHAIEAAPPGEHELRIATRHDGDHVVVTVSDTGTGMTEETLHNIFTPFFSTKPQGRGSGLGLSISRDIVASLGGRLEVSSAVGEGSTFEVWLPIAPSGPRIVRSEASVGKLPRPDALRRRVLIIDDDVVLARAVAQGVRRYHDVEVASSGPEALRRLREGETFDIVLCDLMMPEMNGAELGERLADEFPRLLERTIVFSGGAVGPEAAAFIETAALPILRKPASVATIVEAIDARAAPLTEPDPS